MRKIILSLFGGALLFLISYSTSNAQLDPSICDPINGCVRCTYNLATETCNFDPTNPIPGASCEGGAQPPSNIEDLCRTHDGDPAACQSDYRSCESATVENGGFICNVDGINRSCSACDSDPNTEIPNCPTGAQIYNSEAACVGACIIPSENYDCVQSGGACQSFCTINQEELSGATCQPGTGFEKCCRTRILHRYLCTNNDQITGIDTAIGCIPFAQPESIASFLLKWSVRIAGGIAMLTFLAAGFVFITSSGDPEKISYAKDLFVSAIAGLLMIIFSVFLLQFIGFNILQIFQP